MFFSIIACRIFCGAILMADPTRYRRALDQALNYAKTRGYAGYSKFDALNSPLLDKLSFNINPLRWAYAQAVYRFPLNIRPLLQVKPGINPKAMGLFALARLLAAQVEPENKDVHEQEAREILSWLENNRAQGYHGMCCGYNYIWPNLRFYAPANSPNLVVTGNVIIAFLTAYEQLGDAKYLEIARSSVDFILNDLNTIIDTPTERAISYIPNSSWIVLNNQGLAAVIMAWVAKHTGENHLLEMARRHIQFLANQETDYGAWYYAYPPESSPVTHDNYHTGNVLDWLLYYRLHTGDETFMPAYARGLEFYRQNLFMPDGMPKHRHNVIYPSDIHSAAQGAVTFSRAAMHFKPEYLSDAERTLNWALDNMQAPDGGFYYMKSHYWTNKTRLMHWNEGLMSVGLGHVLLAQQKLTEGIPQEAKS
jgi:rhamnogalacturonyl hydrolase YesR